MALLLLLVMMVACDRDERVLSIGAIYPLSDSLPSTMIIDSTGQFWLGSDRELRLFHPESTRVVLQRNLPAPARVIGRLGARVYLRAEDTLFVYGAADTLIARGNFENNPVLLEPRGRALLQGARSGAVIAHHPDSLAPIWGWAALAMATTALAVSPEGDRVYQAVIADQGGDAELLVRDFQTGRVLHAMPMTRTIVRLLVDPRGRLYALEEGAGGRSVAALQPGGGVVREVWRSEFPADLARPGGLALGDGRVAVWGMGDEAGLRLLSAADGVVLGRSAPDALDGAFDPEGSLWVLRPGVLHRLE